MPRSTPEVNNIKDGKRLHPTPNRLYRVPGAASGSQKAKTRNTPSGNYHGCGVDYRNQVKITEPVFNDVRMSAATGDGQHYRDSGNRQKSFYEKKPDDRSTGVRSPPAPTPPGKPAVRHCSGGGAATASPQMPSGPL
jgi:hypothetical protein